MTTKMRVQRLIRNLPYFLLIAGITMIMLSFMANFCKSCLCRRTVSGTLTQTCPIKCLELGIFSSCWLHFWGYSNGAVVVGVTTLEMWNAWRGCNTHSLHLMGMECGLDYDYICEIVDQDAYVLIFGSLVTEKTSILFMVTYEVLVSILRDQDIILSIGVSLSVASLYAARSDRLQRLLNRAKNECRRKGAS